MTDRLLKRREVETLTGLGRSTIYRRMERKAFPRPRDLGGAVRWRESDIQAWIAAQGERTYRGDAA